MVDHEHEPENNEAADAIIELDTQSQIFLAMRQQNLELLKIAANVAGFAGEHPPLKRNDVDGAIRAIWDIYSEFYSWIDPEESEDDDEDDEDEDEDEDDE